MKRLAYLSAGILCLAHLFSLLASQGWFFDFFSHFALQYVLGGLLFGVVFLGFKKWGFAVLMLCIAAVNIYEIRTSYSEPWVLSPPHQQEHPNLTLVQFNKLFGNHDYERIDAWLEQNHKYIDVLVIQEVGIHSLYKLQALKKYFPHQFPLRHEKMFNDIMILASTPFTAEQVFRPDIAEHRSATKIIFQIEGMPQPVHIYSLHTSAPMTPTLYKNRQQALKMISVVIAADPHPYKVLIGDLNITPYSPAFQELLVHTGLTYNDYSLLPKTTWFAQLGLPVFKIPIDHILYSPNIKQISKQVGPALGSDHHTVIGKFYVTDDTTE